MRSISRAAWASACGRLVPDVRGPQLDGVTGPGEVHRELLGPLPGGDVEQEETRQVLLALGIRPVRGHGAVGSPTVEPGGRGVAEGLAALELPALRELLEHRVEGCAAGLPLLLRPGLCLGDEVTGRVPPGLRVGVDEDDVLHGWSLSVGGLSV